MVTVLVATRVARDELYWTKADETVPHVSGRVSSSFFFCVCRRRHRLLVHARIRALPFKGRVLQDVGVARTARSPPGASSRNAERLFHL